MFFNTFTFEALELFFFFIKCIYVPVAYCWGYRLILSVK